jgi:hypothetical protein
LGSRQEQAFAVGLIRAKQNEKQIEACYNKNLNNLE